MNLIFDLDGTLIESRPRLYNLFQHLVPTSELTYQDYWALKQQKVSNEAILTNQFGFEAVAIKRFVTDWMGLIEAPEFLALDKCLPNIRARLQELSRQAKLHVCTARQTRLPVLDQLERFGMIDYFDTVMVTGQCRRKEELIATVPDLASWDWIIGDTGADIRAGQALGIKTCAVLSGFLSEKILLRYHPELILPSAADFRT